MEIVLLHNTKAGDQEHSREHLMGLLHDAGHQVHYYSLKDGLKKPEVLKTGEMVVVAGGDGSMRQVALKLVETDQRMAPLPIGTANNIARSLGVNGSAEEIIAGWANPKIRQLDMGRAKGPWGERWFLEGIGIGLIGRAISILEEIDDVSAREFDKR